MMMRNFANNYYLMRYDGVKMDKYSLPNKLLLDPF
jgi:hypothetical protein